MTHKQDYPPSYYALEERLEKIESLLTEILEVLSDLK